MKYYRLTKGKVKHVCLSSEFWLPVAKYVCFHPDFKSKWWMDAVMDLYGMVCGDDWDDPEWDFSKLPSVECEVCELTQADYRKATGDITKAAYYYRNVDEPYYEGVMPENWEDFAQRTLLPSSYWADQFGYSNDDSKILEDEIDTYWMFDRMLSAMESVDHELETEAYERWIYAAALEAAGETDRISYRK